MTRQTTLDTLIVAVLAAAACATNTTHAQRQPPRDPAAIGVRSTPVALNPTDPNQTRIGSFSYAGGLELTGVGTTRLHGLSDLEVSGDDLIAVSDEGDLFEARLVLDARGRLVNIADGRLSRLIDRDGKPLRGKRESDAEGLAVLPNGDRLVSFERNHRIWLYPAGDGRPVAVSLPAASFPANEGIEALVPYAPAGPNAYLAGSEGGRIWLCSTQSACKYTTLGTMVPAGFALTGMAVYDESGSLVMLGRAYDPRRGARAVVRLFGPHATDTPNVVAELPIDAPLTRDNFEGVAAVRLSSGVVRIYLVSDDNFSPSQHTYLLAFDWSPTKP